MSVEISPPFRVFTDVDGEPLEDGYIFIGAVNQNPQAAPVSVYWDKALTIPAAQPIRTLGGYPSRSGTPSRMYVAGSYSIAVSNKNSTLIYSDLNNIAGDAALRQDLAEDTDPAKNAGMVAFNPSLPYAAGSVGAVLKDLARLKFPEQFASLELWAASGGALGIIAGTYPVTGQLSFPFGTVVHCFGEVTLDASAVVSAAAFPDLAVVLAGGGSLTALPDIATSAAGDVLHTFDSAHGLSEGDIFIIYNPTDGSYSSHRTYYRAGEFRKVSVATSATAVRCDAPQYAGYTDTAVDIYKLDGGSFAVVGSLVIKGSDTVTSLKAFRGRRLIDADISGIKAICPTGPAAIELFQCFNVTGSGVTGVQNRLSGSGTDYGLVFANCQRMRISGQFSGSRHGVTTGGFDDIGCVVNRDIEVAGIMATNFLGGVPGANTHGNSEYVTFSGQMSACSLGGDKITVRGDIIAGPNGVAIEMVEMSGYNRGMRGTRILSRGNPNTIGRGVIDVGGNTVPAAADTLGGVLDCSGMIIDAPNAARVLMFRQRSSLAADIRIKLNGTEVLSAAVGAISLLVGNVSGANFATLDRTGFIDNSAGTNSVAGVDEVIGSTVRGATSGTTSTSATFLDIPITFGAGKFVIAPVLKVSIDKVVNGTVGIVAEPITVTTAGATIRVSTVNNTNFSAAVLTTAYWEANSLR